MHSKNVADDSDTASVNSSSSNTSKTSHIRRTFVAHPPQRYAYLFKSTDTDCMDEISGHMNMFSRRSNPGSYWNLVSVTAEEIAKALKNLQ